ncbi:transcriptional repressor [candidate division WOR-3 bacterium]|nr:transcriptional repressor [candidate division WOR-3 bacterium]
MARKRSYSKILMNVLDSTDSHPSAIELYNLLKPHHKNLSLASVYRNLDYLVKNGEIVKLTISCGFERYDADTSLHGHFVCLKCGALVDFQVCTEDLPLYREMEKKKSYKIIRKLVIAEGYCPNCSDSE